jgi:hypothetical protein
MFKVCGLVAQAAQSFSPFSGNGNASGLSTWPEYVAPLAYRKRLTATRASRFGWLLWRYDVLCRWVLLDERLRYFDIS